MNSGKVWTVEESSTTWVPGFPSGVLPPELASQVRSVSKGAAVGLEVGGVIGAVSLLNGDTLQIVPKVGPTNFFRMLLTAEGLFDKRHEVDRQFVSWGSDQAAEAIAAVLARRFLVELAQIEANGPRFERVSSLQLRESPSGKILLGPSVKRMRLRSAKPFACIRRVRTPDVPENRVLAAAARHAAKSLTEREAWQQELSSRWQRKFYRLTSLQSDLAITAQRLAEGFYGGPRGAYGSCLTLARLILGQAGISLEGRTRVLGDSLFINSATLFENYVRSALAMVLKPMGLTVTKGGAPTQFLYDDGSFELIPDIRISRGLDTLALGDAKYKDPTASDHYQMAAYMRSYGIGRAFLLCPDYGVAKEAVRHHRAADGRTVTVIRLPLRDLDATEELLADLHGIVPFQK